MYHEYPNHIDEFIWMILHKVMNCIDILLNVKELTDLFRIISNWGEFWDRSCHWALNIWFVTYFNRENSFNSSFEIWCSWSLNKDWISSMIKRMFTLIKKKCKYAKINYRKFIAKNVQKRIQNTAVNSISIRVFN